MKSIKSFLATIALIASTLFPFANASAMGGSVIDIFAHVDGTSIHVFGVANSVAVAIVVYNEAGTTQIGSPETATVNQHGGQFRYDITGNFDANKTYKVCAADFDGGQTRCTNTRKLIKTIEVTVKPPKIGETVTVTNYTPDKLPSISFNDNGGYTLNLVAWDKDGTAHELFQGTFEANKDYFATISLLAESEYLFSSDATVKIKGGGVLKSKSTNPSGEFMEIIVKIKSNATGEVETVKAGDTGVALKDSKDKAVANISLGTALVVASALTYGSYLVIRRKTTRKQ